jgi:hypothetical protein
MSFCRVTDFGFTSSGQNLPQEAVKSSLTLAGDLNGHRDANNFVGFPTLRQIH